MLTQCWLVVFFQAEDGIRNRDVTGVQTCAIPIFIPLAGVLYLVWTLLNHAGRVRSSASANVKIGRASCRERV